MSVQQLTLWDNVPLESGYRHLAKLELDQAEADFKEALEVGFEDSTNIETAIKTCQEWQSLINRSADIDLIISTYKDYPFTPDMREFRKALISHIASCLNKIEPTDLEKVKTVFDQLLEVRKHEDAVTLISKILDQYPENISLLWRKAQVQWVLGERSQANSTYLKLLLVEPGAVEKDRIENEKLLELMDAYGPAMTPAYSLLHSIAPSITVPEEVRPTDDDHRRGLECYHLILAANDSLKAGDTKGTVQHRKRLKELSPELFDAYLWRLQQQGR